MNIKECSKEITGSFKELDEHVATKTQYIRENLSVEPTNKPSNHLYSKTNKSPLLLIHHSDRHLKEKSSQMTKCLSYMTIYGTNSQKTRSYIQKQGFTKTWLLLIDLCYYSLAEKLLSHVHSWSFNIFSLEDYTNGHGLFFIVHKLSQLYNFSGTMGIDNVCLLKFLRLLEQGYHAKNPYHNSTHAADVVQAMHFNIQETKLAGLLKNEEILAAILAAACHDLDHPGVNQSFLIKTSNPLAVLYKNSSVLENHHYRATKSLLIETGLLSHLDVETWNAVDNIMKCTILATDISLHQEILATFKTNLDEQLFDLNAKASDRNFILQIALKCADICNPCRPWSICYQWSDMICREFFKQGDCEAKLGFQVFPSFNRHKSTIASVQTGFIQFIVEPLIILWDRFLNSSSSKMLVNKLHENKYRWKKIVEERLQVSHTDVYLRDPMPKNIFLRPVQFENINQNQKKDCELSVIQNSKEHPSKLLNLMAEDSNVEAFEFVDSFLNRRRHSVPMTNLRFSTSPLVAPRFSHFSKNSLANSTEERCEMNIECDESSPLLEEKQESEEAILKKPKIPISVRRGSFPMNVSIIQMTKSRCCDNRTFEDDSVKSPLFGFLSSFCAATFSNLSQDKELLLPTTHQTSNWPTSIQGVLGFGSQDRMTSLFNGLLRQKKWNVDRACKVIGVPMNLSHRVLLLTNQIFTQNLFC